jgi:hypothetical protein
VRLPDGTKSRPFPSYHGHIDDLNPPELAARKEYKAVPAPPSIAALFDKMLNQLAARHGFSSAAQFVKEKHGGVIYHFTLNFLGCTPLAMSTST